MIASMGYPSQTHTVITEDCYILEMHRIPHGKGMSEATKPPVLLVHGVLGSSADWVMGIPEKFLGKYSFLVFFIISSLISRSL